MPSRAPATAASGGSRYVARKRRPRRLGEYHLGPAVQDHSSGRRHDDSTEAFGDERMSWLIAITVRPSPTAVATTSRTRAEPRGILPCGRLVQHEHRRPPSPAPTPARAVCGASTRGRTIRAGLFAQADGGPRAEPTRSSSTAPRNPRLRGTESDLARNPAGEQLPIRVLERPARRVRRARQHGPRARPGRRTGLGHSWAAAARSDGGRASTYPSHSGPRRPRFAGFESGGRRRSAPECRPISERNGFEFDARSGHTIASANATDQSSPAARTSRSSRIRAGGSTPNSGSLGSASTSAAGPASATIQPPEPRPRRRSAPARPSCARRARSGAGFACDPRQRIRHQRPFRRV